MATNDCLLRDSANWRSPVPKSRSGRLRAEIIAIERAFPELRLPQRRRAVRRSLKAARTRTRKMSAAARKAVSARMKRYWAERRKAQANVK
jgi:hypothetical protein